MRCVRCGYKLQSFEDECPVCGGRQLPPDAWTCANCGAQNRPSATFCAQCGAPKRQRRATVPTKLGTFGLRVLAQLVDTTAILVLVAILVIAATVAAPEWALSGSEVAGLTIDQFALVATLVIALTYHTVLVAAWGATIGKLVFRMRVVTITGQPVNWWQTLLRTVGLLASLVTLGVVFLWIPRDRKNQGLHDKLAGTIVVKV